MRTLTLNELDSVSGGASGRDIAMAIGTLSGQFVAGGIGAAAGGVAGGAIYDYASTHKPNPAMSPSDSYFGARDTECEQLARVLAS